MAPTGPADGPGVGCERKKGVRDDFKVSCSAIGRTELPFIELSCEMFLTSCEVDRRVSGTFQMRTLDQKMCVSYPGAEASAGQALASYSSCVNFLVLLSQNATHSGAWNNANVLPYGYGGWKSKISLYN